MIVDPASAEVDRSARGLETRLLSIAGGLTQFGAYLAMIPPGGVASQRHWHSLEDEFALVLDGQLTVIDDAGPQDLGPMDAAGWRRGAANAHHVVNRSDSPARYLIVGSRVQGDICTYPDSQSRQINGRTDWRVEGFDGAVLRGGALPDDLMNLPEDWAGPIDPDFAGPSLLPLAPRVWVDEVALAHPVLGAGQGPLRHCVLGDLSGLAQFGVHLEDLPPGSASGHRHWHETEDELVLMLSGEVMLVEDSEAVMRPGDMACWPAGLPVGHCLQNRSDGTATYLTVGTRKRRDVIHYPDHDLIVHKDGAARAWFHADGRHRGA